MTARTLILSIAAAAALTLTVQAQVKPTAESQLQAAINQELLNGDLPAAIKSYEAIVATYGKTNRPIAAQALERIANAHDRLGDDQARNARLRIVRDFADQRDVATRAQARLTAAGSSTQASTAPRLVWGKAAGLAQGGISADGVAAIVGEGGRIGLHDLTTGDTKWLDVRLDPDDDEGGTPVLSPDGSAVVYTRAPRSLLVVGTAPGSRPRVLVSNPDFGTIVPHAWSPDGKLILVSTVRMDGTWQISWVSAADRSMKTLRSLDWRFTYGMGVSLSPDGRFVAYPALPENPAVRTLDVISRSDTHIYVVPADGSGREVEVVRTAGGNLFPAWTPDGKHLLFVNKRGSANSVWAVPMSGATPAGPATLLRDRVDSLGSGLGVTRSGTFYFVTPFFSTPVVSVVSRTGGSPARVVDTFPGSGAVFSPDGKSVAVNRGGAEQLLVIRTLATGDERSFVLKDALRQVASIVWLPDGRSLMAGIDVAEPGTNRRLSAWRRLDLGTGQFTEVLPGADNGSQRSAAISPDGQTFYSVATQTTGGGDSDAIVALDLATHTQRVVWSRLRTGVGRGGRPPVSLLGGLKLSGDGRVLAFSQGAPATGGTHFWRIGVDGSDARELPKNTGCFSLDRDGRSLLCAPLALVGEPMPLQRISIDTGAIEILEPNILSAWKAATEPQRSPMVSFSQDGTQVAVGDRGSEVRELWAIDNVASLLKPR